MTHDVEFESLPNPVAFVGGPSDNHPDADGAVGSDTQEANEEDVMLEMDEGEFEMGQLDFPDLEDLLEGLSE